MRKSPAPYPYLGLIDRCVAEVTGRGLQSTTVAFSIKTGRPKYAFSHSTIALMMLIFLMNRSKYLTYDFLKINNNNVVHAP